mgnify:CR=1 FL=1
MSNSSKEETKRRIYNTKEQGDDAMDNSVMSYAALDLHSLSKKNIKIVFSKDALKEIVPIAWGEEVLQGRERVIAAEEKNEEYATDV